MKTSVEKKKENITTWPYLRWVAGRRRWKVDTRTKDGGSEKFFELRDAAVIYRDQVKSLRESEGSSAFDDTELAKFGLTVADAIRFTLSHYRKLAASVSLSVAAASLVEAKKSTGKSEEYYHGVQERLARLAKSFPDKKLSEFSTSDLDGFLNGLGVSPSTRNTFRRDICTLWNYGSTGGRKWCDATAATDTERATVVFEGVEILTPAQLQQLLVEASPEVLPALVIAAFCPIRQGELAQLDWSRVDLSQRVVTIDAKIAKKNARRTMTIPDNAVEWLRSRVWTGPIVSNNFRNEFDRVRVKAGFKPSFVGRRDEILQQLLAKAQEQGQKLEDWPNNGLRHSAISYRLAIHRNIAEVALEAGNSPNIIRGHYLELVMPSAATMYFEIRPPVDEDEAYRKELATMFNEEIATNVIQARKEARAKATTKTQRGEIKFKPVK